MFHRTLRVTVDFPALDNLVAFLRENQQQQIDQLVTQVGALTQKLKQSGDKLSEAITTEQSI